MKLHIMKATACLAAGIILFGAGALQTPASTVDGEAVNQASGLSIALSDVSQQTEDTSSAAALADTESGTESDAEYANIGVVEASGYVNIRSEASTDSEIVGKMENHSVATVEGEENGWYKVTSGEISGYVLAEYLTVGDSELVESVRTRIATVQTETLKVRSEASLDSGVRMMVGEGTQLTVIDEDTEGWVHITSSDIEGYVAAEYVSVEDTYIYAKTPEEVSGGSAVATYALQFVGNPYKWGGTSLTNGTDCSGFIMSVYAHFGVSLPHSSSALRSVGTKVSYSEAQPGDIICYSGHVALYIGNGQIVHASTEKTGIKVSSATYKNIITVRRIFQ